MRSRIFFAGPRLSRAAAATTTGERYLCLLRHLVWNALRLWRAAVRGFCLGGLPTAVGCERRGTLATTPPAGGTNNNYENRKPHFFRSLRYWLRSSREI